MTGLPDAVVELLDAVAELLDGYQDADCVGDPPRFVPNQAMQLRTRILELLAQERCPG
jgi:hypothetical protein